MTPGEFRQIKDLVDDSAAKTEHHFDEKAAEMRRYVGESAPETRRHFDVVAEALTADIRLVAEGHVTLNEKMDRMREEMPSGFDKVRSAIRFSYAELDSRVSTLESQVVN